jgi:uncharacterized protein YndB with AHSA1/START domain
VAVIGKHGVVVSEITVDATPEVVYEFFSEPEKLSRWLGISAEVDRRPGGTWRIDVNGQGLVTAGEIVERQPPHRLVLTFGWEQPGGPAPLPPGASTVEVTLTPEGDGTHVRVEHRDLPPELRVVHDLGWEQGLARLAVAATGGDPGPSRLASISSLDELESPGD